MAVQVRTEISGLLFFVACFVCGCTVIAANSERARPIDIEQVALRRWIGVCATLMIASVGAQAFIAVERHLALFMPNPFPDLAPRTQKEYAVASAWFVVPLVWFYFDWRSIWKRLLAAGPKYGYTVRGSCILMRMVSTGVVLMSWYMTLASALGWETAHR